MPRRTKTKKAPTRATKRTPQIARKFDLPSAPSQRPPRKTRSGLRSGLAIKQAEIDDPESILRKGRKVATKEHGEQPQPSAATTPLTRSNLERFIRTTQPLLVDTAFQRLSSSGSESPDEEIARIQEIDPEVVFDLKWGYLPPLDEDTLAVLSAIFAHQPAMSEALEKVKPNFKMGLEARNVELSPDGMLDPLQDQIVKPLPQDQCCETDHEKKTYETLWEKDKAIFVGRSNEALFQRTVMMNLIARHLLIYGKDASRPQILALSVEECWTCLSPPSEAFVLHGGSLLTKPKPDLAVSFSKEMLTSARSWRRLPLPTQRLACYEDPRDDGQDKLFHFLTIEAKKGLTSIDNSAALHQSLNNASQSLYNMWEFFREAGPDHEQKFFEKVRFFSVVATTEGCTFRIHRAIKITEKAEMDIDGYPLEFVFRDCKRLQSADCNRGAVLEILKPILLVYARDTLFVLLKEAIEAIQEKFMNDRGAKMRREEGGYHLYGDYKPHKKSKQNPRGSKSGIATQASKSTNLLTQALTNAMNKSALASKQDSSMRSGSTAAPKVSHITQKKRGRDLSDEGTLRDSESLASDSPKRQRMQPNPSEGV